MVKWPEFYTFCQVLNKVCEDKIIITYLTIYIKVEEAWKKYKDII